MGWLDENGLTKLWSKIKSYTASQIANNIYEANLRWGGKNHVYSYAPIDAAMVPELGANRLAFGNGNAIAVEYSRNGGSTWSDYGLNAAQKSSLFTENGCTVVIGKADSTNKATASYMLRVTIDTSAYPIYTVLNKFVIYCSTNGSTGPYCTIEASLESTPTTWKTFVNKQAIAGWSGYNVINTPNITTYGNSLTVQYGLLRFTFGCTGGSTQYNGLQIVKIMGFGGVGWTTPSNMAKYGRIFTYDGDQNVTFPNKLTANGGFKGALYGNASTATQATQDSSGQIINATYIKSLSKSGNNLVYEKGDGAKGTLEFSGGGTNLLAAYPVGSIYISVNNVNPSTLFGGTWVAFGAGRTLVGVDTSQTEFNTIEKTGGHKEIQSHSHGLNNHTHGVSGTTASAGAHVHAMYYKDDITTGGRAQRMFGDSDYTGTAGNRMKSAGAHTHTFNVTSGGASGNTANTGSGNGKNLQPYITVYMWKRTE